MSRNISSDDIKEPLLPTIGEGIEFVAKSFHTEGSPAITARCPYEFENGLRKCHMNIRSWVGISIGAVHSYVDLEFYGCTVNNLDGTRHELAGTSPNNIPEIAERTTIEVRRPVTQRDITHAKKRKDGWIPRPKDTIRDFWSDKEAYDAGVACFKEKFAPGWVLLTNDPDTGDEVEAARS
jgi:hypothetical protein